MKKDEIQSKEGSLCIVNNFRKDTFSNGQCDTNSLNNNLNLIEWNAIMKQL